MTSVGPRAEEAPNTSAHTSPQGGWHWGPWLCEYVGTALLLIGGLSAVFLDFGPSSPIAPHLPSTSARLLLTGLLFAGTGSLVALSPLGRRSGAHLNPAVTLAFWTQHKVHPHDLAGYTVSQLLGAFTACLGLRLAWGHTARILHLGATQPGHGFSGLDAGVLEMFMTAALILMIFFLTSSVRTARWTPLGNWLLVATLVWQGAPYTGTSLNPARSIAPALLAPERAHLWVYLVGPCAGALLAAGVFAAFRDTHVLTAKLFHDPTYPTTLGTDLPARAQHRATLPAVRRLMPAPTVLCPFGGAIAAHGLRPGVRIDGFSGLSATHATAPGNTRRMRPVRRTLTGTS